MRGIDHLLRGSLTRQRFLPLIAARQPREQCDRSCCIVNPSYIGAESARPYSEGPVHWRQYPSVLFSAVNGSIGSVDGIPERW
jgi:hypothetical protein